MTESQLRVNFWELPIEQLNRAEWEALCDGCARCCLQKLQDDDNQDEPNHGARIKVVYTRVVCRLLDQQKCRCTRYAERQALVPDCLVLDRDNLPAAISWMPSTCAYKLRFQDKPLPEWHPLLNGSDRMMKEQHITVTGRVLSEEFVHDRGLEEHVIRWVTP
jgi:uncharacterized cysteine cluster protein YcgN (CxxCxxCC family)